MKSLMITCKETSELVSKKEERKLTFVESFQFYFHLAICKFCALFYRQNKIFLNHLIKLSADVNLTEVEKEKMSNFLESQKSSK